MSTPASDPPPDVPRHADTRKPSPQSSAKDLVQNLLRRVGYQFIRVQPADLRYERPSFDPTLDLPPGAERELRPDHPRLLELRERYARCQLPMPMHTMWQANFLERELQLGAFRGDNPYVWQFRNVGADARRKYYLYLRDVASRDTRGLLKRLEEDGLFGCWTFDFPDWPLVSRDLLDSINELYFLDRQLNLFGGSCRGWTVLDIGAGYGRLAHRALTAVPDIRYVCSDAVPESSFLCEYHLRFRGCMDRAEVVPLDELQRLDGRCFELAVNVHSFSEMSA